VGLPAWREPHIAVTSPRKGAAVEEDEQEPIDQVRDWVGRLEAFADALDDIEGDWQVPDSRSTWFWSQVVIDTDVS
jgi:hypothetical protein